MFNLRKGLFMDTAGAPAGGGAAAVVDPPAAGAGEPAAGAGAPPNPQVGGAPSAAKYDWASLKLDPDLQAVVDHHGFENPGSVVKSFANVQKLMGHPADRILKMPDDKSTPEQWNEYYTKLGRPAKAEDYKLPVPAGDSGEFAKTAANWMHKAGVPAGMATKLATEWNEFVAGNMKAAKTTNDAKIATENNELKTEWGGEYDKNFAVVDRALTEFGVTKEQMDGLRSVLGPKSAMKLFHKIGAKVGTEGEFLAPEKGGEGFQQNRTVEQAKAELAALVKDPAHQQMFNSKDPKTRQEARAKQRNLEIQAAPGTTSYAGPAR